MMSLTNMKRKCPYKVLLYVSCLVLCLGPLIWHKSLPNKKEKVENYFTKPPPSEINRKSLESKPELNTNNVPLKRHDLDGFPLETQKHEQELEQDDLHELLKKAIAENNLRAKREEGRGFQLITNDGSMYGYSAYYDPIDDPQLRVLVICKQVYMNISYTCKVKLKSGEIHHVPGAFTIFLTFLAYKYEYVSGVIKCQLTDFDDPDELNTVSIHPSRSDLARVQHNLTTPLQFLKTVKHQLTIMLPGTKRVNTLTRCLSPMHGKYKIQKLIWSIEISRLSGVDRFIFYNYSMSPEVDKVLRHYMEEGIVEVRNWNLPESKLKKKMYYFGQVLAEHDCLISQTFVSKYVLMTDLDEVILPNKGLSIVDKMDDIFDYHDEEPGSNLGSVTFRCFSFIKNSNNSPIAKSPEFAMATKLDIEPLLYTTYFIPRADSKKALVIPERIDRLCVHSACFLRHGFTEKRLTPQKEAVLLHYRDSPRHMEKDAKLYEFYDLLKYSHEIADDVASRATIIDS